MATKQTPKNYAKIGIIAAIVVVIAALGAWGISAITKSGGGESIGKIMQDVSPDAVTGADLRIAIVRMDEITNRANALVDLRKQKESFESKLRAELEREQKSLEKEKTEIEKSQDVLSRDALQRRVVEYQNRIAKLQRDVTERAQAIEAAFQSALARVQENDLNPVIEGIIAKKDLSLVIDGRFARISDKAADALDITGEVVKALDRKVSHIKMDTPKGF